MPSRTNPSSSKRRPATVRIARWSATHPWRAIALWLVFVVACIAAGQAVQLDKATALDTSVGQSGRAAHLLHDTGLTDPARENVLIGSRSGRLDTAAGQQVAADLSRRMRQLAEVATVAAPSTAKDGSLLLSVTMRGDPQTADDRVAPLLAATATVQQQHPELRVEQAGTASTDNAVNDQVASDLGTAADISLPVTVLILLLAFGAVIAAGVPVLLALSAVGAASGLSVLSSQFLPDSGSTSSMILMIGMAVGVDYSLFYVKRAREEHAAGRGRLDAIEIAAETSGHSVVVSGVAVIVSMMGLYLAKDVVFASLATGSIIVVAIAVLGSLTVLPALLVKIGNRIDRPRVPLLWRLSAADREPRLWPALLKPALQRPGRTLTVSVLVLVALALPAFGLTLHSDSQASLPRSMPMTQTLNRISAAFPEHSATDEIVVSAPAATAGAVTAQLTALHDRLAHNPLFATGAAPQLAGSADSTVHMLRISVPSDGESAAARTGLRQLRAELVPAAQAAVPGSHWYVGGEVAGNIDYDEHLSGRLPWVVGFVVLLTMLIMLYVFRSPLIALLTAGMNLLSAGAAFGVLVVVFQHTWAEGILDFTSTGSVINWVPLFTFTVLFGLSMDYHIFVMSRIREAVRAGLSTREAVRSGISGSAGTITSAALVMVSVFAIFASLHMVEMKQLGVGLAVAVLIDAVLVRTILLPSALVLLGERAWPRATRRPVRPALERLPELAARS